MSDHEIRFMVLELKFFHIEKKKRKQYLNSTKLHNTCQIVHKCVFSTTKSANGNCSVVHVCEVKVKAAYIKHKVMAPQRQIWAAA